MSDENNSPVDIIHINDNPPDLGTISSLKGTRLEPIMNVLAMQPDELKGTIISRSTEMLNLWATIKQREKTHTRFTQPVTAAAPANGAASDAETPKPFIPNSLRKLNPVAPSKQMNDDPAMRVAMNAADKAHGAYQITMAEHAKTISELEISLRKKQLRSKFYDFVATLALAYVVTKKTLAGGFAAGMQLTQDEIIIIATFNVIRDLDTNAANIL